MTSQHKASLVHRGLQHVLCKTHFRSPTASQLKMRFREKGSYLIFPFEMFPCASQSASWFEERNCPKSSWRELQALDQRSASWNFSLAPNILFMHVWRGYSRENNPSTVTCVQTSSHRQKGSYLIFLFEMFPVASQSASSSKIRMTPILVCIILLTDLSSGIPVKSSIQISTQAILRKPQDSKSTIEWHRMSERVEQSRTSVAGGRRRLRREICKVKESNISFI